MYVFNKCSPIWQHKLCTPLIIHCEQLNTGVNYRFYLKIVHRNKIKTRINRVVCLMSHKRFKKNNEIQCGRCNVQCLEWDCVNGNGNDGISYNSHPIDKYEMNICIHLHNAIRMRSMLSAASEKKKIKE